MPLKIFLVFELFQPLLKPDWHSHKTERKRVIGLRKWSSQRNHLVYERISGRKVVVAVAHL